MAFKLIRDAQIKSSMPAEQVELLETVKRVLGADTLAAVSESVYRPTPEDYAKWLDVIIGYAQDSGTTLSKKANFLDIAGAVLENDPLDPPYSMHEAIMKKLWLDFKAKAHATKIEKVARAQEEEERISQSLSAFAEPQEDDEYDEYADSEVRDMKSSADDPAADEEAWWHEDMPDAPDDGGFNQDLSDGGDEDRYDENGRPDPNGMYDAGGHMVDGDQMNDRADMEHDRTRDDQFDREMAENEESSGRRTYTSKAEWRRAAKAAHPTGRFWGDPDTPAMSLGKQQGIDRGGNKQVAAWDRDSGWVASENEEAGGEGTEAAGVAAAPKKMNMLQTMLSMPKTSINQSLKGVESEGQSAWKQHSMPKNPHPEGSMAYKAFERGMKKAMKDHLGLNEKPEPVKKKKK